MVLPVILLLMESHHSPVEPSTIGVVGHLTPPSLSRADDGAWYFCSAVVELDVLAFCMQQLLFQITVSLACLHSFQSSDAVGQSAVSLLVWPPSLLCLSRCLVHGMVT